MSTSELPLANQSWYQILFAANPIPMLICDRDRLRVLAANQAACQHYGYAPLEWQQMSIGQLCIPAERLAALTELDKEPTQAVRHTGVWKHLRKDGGQMCVKMLRYLIPFQGRTVALLMLQDISEQVRAQEEIQRLAFYDEVTGLPNRVMLRQKLKEFMHSNGSRQQTLALLIVDLVRFRDINYSLGHLNGNVLLKAVGARIRDVLDDAAVLARVGTRFIILLPDTSAAVASECAREILAVLAVPLPIVGITYEMGAHIGIGLAPEHATDTDSLLRKADVALYQVKQTGHNFALYNPDQDPYNPQRLALIGEFRNAIQAGELQLYCQPKVDFRSGQTVGAEALVRWQHPRLGLVAPDRFVPLIESTDLIHVLTQFMVQSAAQQCLDWHRKGMRIPLAVNLSTRNLLEPDLTEQLQQLLVDQSFDPDWLGLEITESSLMQDPQACIDKLERLSGLGFRLYVDDFGTGYSSLSYLTRLPVQVIKIDHGFTMQMTRDQGAATIVKSTIDLAHNLGMSVVAEGTANQEIWNALSELRCDEAQGHFISPPLPAAEFAGWLAGSGYPLSARPVMH